MNQHIKSSLLFLSCSLVFACGSDGGDSGADAGPNTADADINVTGPCNFENKFLPYKDGYAWTYKVTDLVSGETSSKSQKLSTATDPDLGAIIVQTTTKSSGSTVGALKIVDNAVVRLRQEDLKKDNSLQRTSVYDPGQTRFNHSPDKLEMGAKWDETYTVTVTDSQGVVTSTGSRIDKWEVLGVDVDCTSPLGSFKCLHLKKTRNAISKQYFYAKGIGKVKEVNANQIEELLSCP